MSKVQLNLTDEETAILADYGAQFGYNIPKTVRFIISKTAEEYLGSKAPIYKLSDSAEAKGLKALKEYRQGKTTKVTNFKKFFNQ